MAVANMTVRLGLDLTGFQKGLAKAVKGVDKVGKSLRSMGKSLSLKVTAPVAAFGTLAVRQFAKVGDEIAKTSKRVGISTKTLSGLRLSADLAGSSFRELVTGFRRLSSAAFDAKSGLAESKRAFDELDVSVTDSRGNLRSMEDIFFDVADGIAQMEDQTKAAALAQDVFGRAGLQLIPLLQQGSAAIREQMEEAERLGIVFDEGTAKAAEDLTDAITRMRAAFLGVALKIASVVGPTLTNVFETIATKIAAIPKRTLILGAAIAVLAATVGPLLIALGLLISAVSQVIAVFGGLLAIITGISAPFVAVGVALLAVGLLALIVARNWDKLKDSISKAVRFIISEVKRLVDAVTNAVEKIKNKVSEVSTKVGRMGRFIGRELGIGGGKSVKKAVTKITAPLKKIPEGAKKAIDTATDLAAIAGDNFKAEMGMIVEDVGNMFGGLTGKLTGFVDDIAGDSESAEDSVTQAIESIGEKILSLNDKIAGSKEEFALWFADIGTVLEDMQSLTRDVFGQFAQGIGDAIADTILLGKNLGQQLSALLRNIAKTIIATLIKIGIQRAAQAIFAVAMAKKQTLGEAGPAAAQTYMGQFKAVSQAPFPINLTAPAVATSMATKMKAGAAAQMVAGLAEGGLATRPLIAAIAEGGEPEAVIPLSRMGDMLGPREQTLIVEMDRTEIARMVVRDMPEIVRAEVGTF